MGRKPVFDAEELTKYCQKHGREATLHHFKCSRSTLDNALALYGVVQPTLTQLRRKEQLAWIVEHQATAYEAAQQFGCSVSYVKGLCKAGGVELPKQANAVPVSISNFDILRLLLCNFNYTEISRESLISKQRVEQVAKIAKAAGLLGKGSVIKVKDSVPYEQLDDGRKIYRP